jgi:ABC-2 type transport system ATP-binding protein
MTPMIAVQALCKEYRTPKRYSGVWGSIRMLFTRAYTITRAVDQVSFTVEPGELVGYIGPNGAGKSTTFRMLTGVLVPTCGHVETDGRVPHRCRQRNARYIGAIFGQRSQLWWDLPLVESLRLIKAIYRVPDETYQRNMAAFDDVMRLGELLETPVRQLSLGQRMRGELAAALLHDPQIVYLDEPLLGLDVVAKENIRRFIAQICAERGATIMLASNDMADVEKLCQRILIIDKGRLLYDGTIEDLKAQHAPYRTLVVHFARDYFAHGYPPVQADGTELVRQEGLRAWFRFARTVNPQRLITDLGGRYAISDLAIEEPTLEEVIRGIYGEESLVVPESEAA